MICLFAGNIAITFDDLPTMGHGVLTDIQRYEYFLRTLDTLDSLDIQITGFAIGGAIQKMDMSLLRVLTDRGHILGNHSFSHPDLSQTDVSDYIDNIKSADSLLSNIEGYERIFRFPYLRMGDEERGKAVLNWLKEEGYQVAHVTIDNSDWMYNSEFVKALGDSAKMESIASGYIEHILERTAHFDSVAQAKTGRDIDHILLLHMTYINSWYIDELVNALKHRGWSFIPLVEALEDPVYQRPDNWKNAWGVSWLERID